MNILEKHSLARKKSNVFVHNIKTEYKKGERKIYIVCEGREDLGYYGQVIKRKYADIQMKKQYAVGKESLLEVYSAFDWKVYEKNKILFFVDRDFSYWTGEEQFIDTNVYITDQYSFENDAVNVEMFMEVLEDFYGFANAKDEELEKIREIYLERWKVFCDNSTYGMAAVLVSNIVNKQRLAKYAKIKKMIKIDNENVWVEFVKGKPIKEYLYEKLKLSRKYEEEILRLQSRFEQDKKNYSVRGKWALGFMVEVLEYIMENAQKYVPSLYSGETNGPKRMCQLTEGGTMVMLAPRIQPARSLETFLESNINCA